MDLLSGDVEALAVKTWFWKTDHKNPVTNMFDPKFYDYKDFNTLGLVILTSSKTSEYGKLIVAEECKTDDSTDKSVYRLQVVLTYSGKEKAVSLETVFRKRKDEKFYIYYLEDIKTSNLLKITWKFSEMKTYCEASGETGQRNIKEEPKENEGASNQKTQYITRTVLDNRGSKSDSDDKGKENSRKRYQENEEGETSKSTKDKGLVALSGSLKNVCLTEEDSDVILKVGDQSYPAHKVIIRARSPVFKAMLEHDMTEKNEGVVDIEDCNPYIFRDFLLYLYTGKLENMSKENVFELYHISDKYDIKELKSDCVEFMLKNISVDIICDVILLATRYCERNLLARATEFFSDNTKDILETVNWQNFVKDNPIEANELFLKTVKRLSRTRVGTRRNLTN